MSSGLAARPERATRSRPGAKQEKDFRRDIQGIRALGLVLVLTAHTRLPFGEGGFVALDTFFVVSGFLITGLIVAEMERTGALSLARFYARRVRRLLPAVVTVLLFVVVASALLYSPVQSDRVAGDVVAASLYFVNWRFASQSVDYFAVDPADSPLQHFWSLSVEEQFYLAWPALLLLAFAWWARGGRRHLRPVLLAVVAAVGLPSLIYSAFVMDMSTNAAYFSTVPRIWELALGAALMLVLPATVRLPRPVAALLGWAGIGVILWTALTFEETMPYPGSAALLPTLATVAIIVAGTASVTTSPTRLLSTRPMQYLGRLSYSWYLWHWPLLVFARAELGPLTAMEDVLIVSLAWVPTALTYRFIEAPFRYSGPLARSPRKALAFGGASAGGAVMAAMLLTNLQPSVPTASSTQFVGAAAAMSGKAFQERADVLRPPPRAARDDRGRLYEDGCLVPQEKLESPECVYGNRSSDKTVVLFGNSHAMHYFPALLRVARKRDWRLVALTRAGCPIEDVHFAYRCDYWREYALDRMETREHPDLVVVGSTTTSPLGVIQDGERLSARESRPLMEEGMVRTLRRLRSMGARVVVMKDLPRSPEDIPSCVSRSLDRLNDCAFRKPPGKSDEFDARAAARVGGARLVSAIPLLCPNDRCPAVIGNSLVYRDTNHFTATFARTLAPWLDRRLPEL